MADNPLLIAVAQRPFPGERVNGDAACVTWHAGRCRIALIDGLGHGPAAALAAQAAVTRLKQQPALHPTDALIACHEALAGTRGAAISIAQLDLATRQLSFAGIGNVDGRLGTSARTTRLSPYRGIVGYTRHTVRSFEYVLDPDWWLLLHTDGISSRMEAPRPIAHDNSALQDQADQLLDRWSRLTDDATVILVIPHDEQ